MSEKLRNPKAITKQLYRMRVDDKTIYTWPLERVAADMQAISSAMSEDLSKLAKKNFKNKQALKRVRSYTKALNMLGLRFRTMTV